MTSVAAATRAEVCVVACAEAWRGDGAILASPMGHIPRLGALLARRTFAPDLVLSDGEAYLVDGDTIEGWLPYRAVFGVVASGRRHVMMGASQLDRYGNQNIAFLGPADRPTTQLLGMRGAPGNTINDKTSYWIPNHSTRVFVPAVDVVSGIGYDRAAELGDGARFHHLGGVVTNLAMLDFDTPDHRLRLRSVHPGVTVDDVVGATGFELVVDSNVPESRPPDDDELRWLREVIDPNGVGEQEVPA